MKNIKDDIFLKFSNDGPQFGSIVVDIINKNSRKLHKELARINALSHNIKISILRKIVR